MRVIHVSTATSHPVHSPTLWRPGCMGGRVLHAGVLVPMAPCWKRAPGARTSPPAPVYKTGARLLAPALEHTGRRFSSIEARLSRRASTTVRIVRELPGGGMSPRFRWEPRGPCGHRAGTTKNPRQTFRPTGGSVMLETLLPVRR